MKSQSGANAGPARLFFGCRRSDEDFLYKTELEQFAADGTLSSLDVAFSRAGPEKVYVQHLMLKQVRLLAHSIFDCYTCPSSSQVFWWPPDRCSTAILNESIQNR